MADTDSVVVPPIAPPNKAEVFSREYVHELREESKGYRTKTQEAQALADAAVADAKKAREEADQKVTAAQASANERIIRAELKAEAIKAGMVDLDGLKLADLSKVKLNDAGEVEGADALMTELKKAKPYLFGTPGSTSNTETKPPKPGAPEIKDATTLSKEEYKKARDDIRRGIVPAVKA